MPTGGITRVRVILLPLVAGLAGILACSGDPSGPGGSGRFSINDAPPGPAWDGTATMVTVGDRANCLLQADGTPWCWGNTRGIGLRVDYGIRNVPAGVDGSGLIDSVCIARRTSPSHLPPWPCNVFKPIRISDRSFTTIRLPVQDYPPCAIDAAGSGFCWDQGPHVVTTPDSTLNTVHYCGGLPCLLRPQPLRTGVALREIARGGAICAVGTAGAAMCSSVNTKNLLGNRPLNFRSDTLITVAGAPSAIAIASSIDDEFACAIATGTSKVWCWGNSEYGAVGNGSFSVQVAVPVQVTSALTFKAIAASSRTVCALATAGQAYCWGDGRIGQIGWNGFGWSTTPAAVTGARTFNSITAGPGHFCALDTSGAAWCWGDNAFGQLGVTPAACGGGICSAVPVAVQGGHTFRQISAGIAHTCGVTTANQVYCWGSTAYGRLGLQLLTTTYIASPTRIMP